LFKHIKIVKMNQSSVRTESMLRSTVISFVPTRFTGLSKTEIYDKTRKGFKLLRFIDLSVREATRIVNSKDHNAINMVLAECLQIMPEFDPEKDFIYIKHKE
jgi:hypothetical protein